MRAKTKLADAGPPRMFGVCVLLILLQLNGFVASKDKCQQGCTAGPNKLSKLKYAVGTGYTYSVDSTVTIQLTGADQQDTQLRVLGQFTIVPENKCNYVLQLQKSFSVNTNGGKKLGFAGDLQKPIRFTITNDQLLTEICADIDDTESSLNIKRALISMFYTSITTNSQQQQYETDVFGKCPTIIQSEQLSDASTTVVAKVRNLNLCGYRENLANGLITSIFDEKSGVKSTPLLNGDYSSEQRIKNGIVDTVLVNEEYKFIPFSNNEAGTRAKVQTKVKYQSSAVADNQQQLTETINSKSYQPKSIIFDTPDVQTIGNLKLCKSILQATIMQFVNTVQEKSAGKFVDLIKIMRTTKKDDLLALYQQIKAGNVNGEHKQLARNIFFDALFRAGTGDSVEVCANLLKNRELNDNEQKLIYKSMNYVQSMTKDALLSITKLLDNNPPKEAFLAVGILVNKYCRKNNCESSEIKQISDKFVSKLGNCRAETKEQEDMIVAVLKGIKNTDNLVNPALDRVIVCIGDKISTRIRVAALQALTAAGCNRKSQTAAMALLKNHEEDSEVRIQAYLSATKCPTPEVANELKTILDTETVYQVGSYIVSHLAGIRASTDQSRLNARHHFGQIRTTNKFPSDIRKYSFNRELSYFVESLGMGASAETDIIYSQNSFVPRSMRLNMTSTLFGHSFNFAGINVRAENIDSLLEYYFGPRGLFQQSPQAIYDMLAKQADELRENTGKRFTRGIREDIQLLARQVKMSNDVTEKDIDLDVSVEFFGTEMHFLTFGNDMALNQNNLMEKLFACVDKALTNAKGYESTHTNNALFMDTELIYTTGIGLPLKLSAQGASTIEIQTAGQFDFKEIVQNPKNMKFQMKLMPSVNIQVSGTLSVEATGILSTGLQVTGNLYSSTGMNVNMALRDNAKGLHVNVELPLAKQEIITVDHTVVFVREERGTEIKRDPLKFSSKRTMYNECFDQLSPYIGLTFCTDVELTMPGSEAVAPFPLTGPNKFAVRLDVEKAYSMDVFYDDKNTKHQSISVVFDTPNSKESRLTKIKLETALEPNAMVRVALESPYRNAAIEAGYTNNDRELIVYAKASNGGDQYLGKFGFQKNGGATGRQEYIPIVQIQTPSKNDDVLFGYKATGKIVVEPTDHGSKYIFNNIQLIGTGTNEQQQPLKINGFIVHNSNRIDTDLKLERAARNAVLKGHFEFSTKTIDFDMAVLSNFHEMANGRLIYTMDNDQNQMKNKLTIIYGDDIDSKIKRIEIVQSVVYTREDKKLTSLEMVNGISLPFVPAVVRVDGSWNVNQVKYDIEFGYNKNKISSIMDLAMNSKSAGDYVLTLNGQLNKHSMKLNSKRVIENGVKSRLTNKLTTSFGTVAELNGIVGHKFNRQEADVDLTLVLVLADKQEPYKLNVFVHVTPKVSKANVKMLLGKVEYVTYESLVNRGDTVLGTFKIALKDTLNGNGEFKMTNGRGDANALITIEKNNRQLKLDTTFNIAQPIFEISSDLFYDYEKDNAKKLSFVTKSKFDKKQFDTRNSVQILSEKYELNCQGSLNGQSVNDGIVKGKIDMSLPTGRQLSAEIKREVHESEDTTGQAEIKFIDRLPNKKQRSCVLAGKIIKGQFRARIFDLDHSLKFTDFDSKTLEIDTNVKYLPKDSYRMAGTTLNVKGTLLPQPIHVELMLDEYCSQHAVYHATGNYGQEFDGKINGRYEIGGRTKPSTYTINTVVNMPNTKVQRLMFESSGELLQPDIENGLYDAKFKTNFGMNDKRIAFTINAKGNENHGTMDLALNTPNMSPIKAEASYSHEENENTTQCQASTKLYFSNDKEVKMMVNMKTIGTTELAIHTTLDTTMDVVKNFDFTMKASKAGEETFLSNGQLKLNGKSYGWNSNTCISMNQPSIDLTVDYDQKTSKFFANFLGSNDRVYKTHVQIVNVVDFNFDGSAEVNAQNADQYAIKFYVDSPKINLNKIQGELSTKPGTGGKSLHFKVLSDTQNILSGTADYTIKDEKGKTIFEGQGNVKLYDKDRTANFKFIKNQLELAKDNEVGQLYILNGQVGAMNIVTEFKLTDKNFHVKHTACEEKKQCINFEIRTHIDQVDLLTFRHQLLVSIDLRQLGYTHEFGLKADTSRNGFVIDHTVDVHFHSQDKSKYQYSFYLHPKSVGITLTLPQRVIAVEGAYTYPKNEIFGNYDARITTYLDKQNRPKSQSQISFNGAVKRTGTGKLAAEATGTLKFVHPKMKPIVVSATTNVNSEEQFATGKMELDIFKNEGEKIVLTGDYRNRDRSGRGFNISTELSCQSRGMNIEYTANGHAALNIDRREISTSASCQSASNSDMKFSSYLFASPQSAVYSLNGFNEELISLVATMDMGGNTPKANIKSTLQFLGGAQKPIHLTANLNGPTSVKVAISRDNLLNINGEFSVGKQLSLILIGANKDLFRGTVALDQTHFLNTEYKVSDENAKEFMATVREEIKKDFERTKEEITKRVAKIQEHNAKQFETLRQCVPDFKAVQDEYKAELEKLADELMADKTIKEIVEFAQKIYQTVIKTAIDIFTIVFENVSKIVNLFVEFTKKLLDAYREKLMPIFNNIIQELNKLVVNVYEESINIIHAIFERTVKALKAFEDDFNSIAATFAKMFKSIVQSLSKYVEQLHKELVELYQTIYEHFQSLPGLDMLKEKWTKLIGGYDLQKYFLGIIQEFTSAIRYTLPTPEVADFLDSLTKYIELKFDNKPIDKELDKLTDMAVSLFKALKSIVEMLRARTENIDGQDGLAAVATKNYFGGLFTPIPFTMDALKHIPIISNVQFSPLNYLRNERFVSVRNILAQYRPYGFSIHNMLPPFTMHAQIADGAHIFTFDQRHYTFNPTTPCQYVLAQDFVNGNFSVVATMHDSKLKSILLMDKGDYVEINDNNAVTLNGKPAEMPIHQKDMHAWRNYYTINILTEYGVSVECTHDLRVCHITVSGYFAGKVRGLFGNGNAEPYDDFTLPNGKITTSYAELGNSYKNPKAPQCTAVQQVDHDHHRANGGGDHHTPDDCGKLFASDSSMRWCFYLIDPAGYREACEHTLHMAAAKSDDDKLKAACTIARTYTSVCRRERIPISLPTMCDKCGTIEGRHIGIDDTYSVRSPQKQADIVVLLDISLGVQLIGDFVQNTINDLRNQLKMRDLTDIQLVVIGYKSGQRYLSYYTTNGKLDFTGKLGQIKFDTAPMIAQPIQTNSTSVNAALTNLWQHVQQMKIDFGMSNDALAFREAMSYPYRAAASKSILVFRSDAISTSSNPLKVWTASLANSQTQSLGISVHLVAPIDGLTIANNKDPNKVKNIVGFNAKTVMRAEDTKRKGSLGAGSTDMRNNLKYKPDIGVEMVQSVNGYVFPLQNYNPKGKDKKTFTQGMAIMLADQMARTEIKSDCVCRLRNGLYAEEQCQMKDTKYLPPIKKAANKG